MNWRTDDDEDDPTDPNPSHYTTEITRFEWPTGSEWWPEYSYRLGNWEWVIAPDKALLLHSKGDAETYQDREELGFASSRSIQISELAMVAVLKRLHTTCPNLQYPDKDINTVVDELLAPFPRKKENL